MCGITGAIAASPSPRIGAFVQRATSALRHRGPDGEGFWMRRGAEARLCSEADLTLPADLVLGHRRLSIVDVEGGSQPMCNEDETVWVSYNGEIYNHLELRTELERKGHRFRTRADTEVLVHGWEEWREGLFGRLNGIFALALADVSDGTVVLVRDPVGVKPLYVGVHGDATWWASELQAAAAGGFVSDVVSADALKLFLTFRYVPSPHTIYEDAWKIPAGHLVRLDSRTAGRRVEFVPYASRVASDASPRNAEEWRDAIVGELELAVERQLMADVPVASLLSGGVDSSLVTQVMAQKLPYAPVAYAIGFEADGAENEARAAERAGEALRVPVETTVVADDDYLAAWPNALEELAEPIANSGLLLVRLICEAVGRSHKVVLTGQGADEPLGGYPRHLVERFHPYARVAPPLARLLARRAFGAEDGARLGRALSAGDRVGRYVEIFSVVPPGEVDAMVEGGRPAVELAREAVGRWVAAEEPRDTVNELLRTDVRMSLADDLLIVADHFSMRSSVELRVPFLDLRLLELLERMPSRYKISRLGKRKWLYREGAARRLPPGLSEELCGPTRLARKRGFSTPRTWFDEGAVLDERMFAQKSLERLPLVPKAAADRARTGGPRQRTLLFALALWADRRELPMAA